MDQVLHTLNQHYYLSKQLGYAYEIAYKPDKENREVDALSRMELEAKS